MENNSRQPGVNPRSPPRGVLEFQRGVLSYKQKTLLTLLKTPLLRQKSIQYMQANPQVDAVISVIVRAILLHRPSNPKTFVKDLVKRPDFQREIERFLVRNGLKKKKDEEVYSRINFDPNVVFKEESREKTSADISLDLSDSASISSMWSMDSVNVFSGKYDYDPFSSLPTKEDAEMQLHQAKRLLSRAPTCSGTYLNE